ncbi:hypothetical protein GCM10027285_26790 [Oleiagrimonas citrea]|uniref:Flagellar basal body rod protein FlgB n=1 Tax=Oleiagrimonas citrea TaxID=1665687 RepID=A0A846ZN80_9GAMM|nr:hypothetical protein [Oleiagrimonas citrea]NKZ39019.1 hypothetical protein [Oleiagrimonas citrea]
MDITTEAVRVGLGMAQAQAWAASANIAGVDVPGAKVYRTDFSEALNALDAASRDVAGAGKALSGMSYERITDGIEKDPSRSADQVRLDDQVAQLNIANTTYRTLINGLSRHYALMQLAIKGE